jgi:hypothetical protein
VRHVGGSPVHFRTVPAARKIGCTEIHRDRRDGLRLCESGNVCSRYPHAPPQKLREFQRHRDGMAGQDTIDSDIDPSKVDS